MTEALLVAALGAAGVLCRFGADSLLRPWSEAFPFSTLAVNLAGSFLAGCLYALGGGGRGPGEGLSAALLVGFCGGFTTFSAMSLQALQLLERGRMGMAVAYLVGSPALGLLAAWLPVLAAGRLGGR